MFTRTSTSTSTTGSSTPSTSRPARRRWAGLLGAAAVCASLVATPTPAEAAATVTRVDVTVAESLAVTTGTVISDGGLDGLGCFDADVETSDLTVIERRDRTTFVGTKSIQCDEGTLTLAFRASVRGCSTTDRGVWRVTGGTGDFADARGGGRLVGTYTGGAGTSCDNTGIDDNYTGIIVLR